MYGFRLLPSPTVYLSRLIWSGDIGSHCGCIFRLSLFETGSIKLVNGGESGFHVHSLRGFSYFSYGRSTSMIDKPFPAKLTLSSSVSHSKPSLPSSEDLTNDMELFFSTAKDHACYTKEMLCLYIERLCKAGNLLEAASLLRSLHERQMHPSLNAYNTLLAASAASETNNFDLFFEIFQKLLLSKLPPDPASYLNVTKVLRRLPDSKLLKFIREASEITAHSEPTVVNRIIFFAAESGEVDRCVMMFEELKNRGCKIDTVTFNTVLAALGRFGRVEEMLSEFLLMKKLGFLPDIVTYGTLINCLRRLGRLSLCKAFAREMLGRGIGLDLQSFTDLIDGLGRAGRVDDAMTLFHEMKKLHRPSIYVYRAMIGNLKKFGEAEAAMALLNEMNSNASNLVGPEEFRKKRGSRMKGAKY